MIKKILNIILTVILLGISVASVFMWDENKYETAHTDGEVVIVVDAGHGGNDPGKVGVNGVLEKDINLQIAFILKEYLEKDGAQVVLTRSEDKGLYEEGVSNKKASDMKARCELAKTVEADIVISIHQNSYTDNSVSGPQVFFYKGSEEGERLASCIQNGIMENVAGIKERPVKADSDYYMLCNTECTTVIIECGFLSNPEEAEKLCNVEYQRMLANGISQGTIDFLRLSD